MSNRGEGFVPIKQKVSRQSSLTNLPNQQNSLIDAGSTTGSIGGGGSSSTINHGGIISIGYHNISTGDYTPIFYQEVSDIMRGFGDCRKPLRESVILVDKILTQQMRGILQTAISFAVERKGKQEPSQRDFEFLLKKNPVKVARLQNHIRQIKDIQRKRKTQDLIVSSAYFDDDIGADANGSDDDADRELPVQHDEEKIRRLFRADRISQTLSGTQYLEYHEARRSSFYCRNSSSIRAKLKAWLAVSKDCVLSNRVYEILSYLAHETIATIVDFSILTRLNSSNRQVEPFSRISSSSSSNAVLHLCPEVTQGRGQDGIKPITVQEIQEAVRRHAMQSRRTMGLYRNIDSYSSTPFLAI